MRHILQGVTYDTDNAIAVAERGKKRTETKLYRDPSGTFFAVHAKVWSDNGDQNPRTTYDWELIGNAAEALRFCERKALTIHRSIEGMPRENEPLGQRLPSAEYSTRQQQQTVRN